MMWAFFKNSLRFHFEGRLKQVLVAMFCLFWIVFDRGMFGATSMLKACVVPLSAIFGAGILGRDFSHGGLALVFTRPVYRWQYVLARWLGLVAWVGGILVLLVLQEAFRHVSFTPLQINSRLTDLVTSVCLVMSLGSLATLLSAFGSGYSNVGLYFGLWLLTGVAHLPAQAQEIAGRLLFPGAKLLAGQGDDLFAWLEWGVLTVVYLLAAMAVVSKREIGYSR